jgi:hypothetical protein
MYDMLKHSATKGNPHQAEWPPQAQLDGTGWRPQHQEQPDAHLPASACCCSWSRFMSACDTQEKPLAGHTILLLLLHHNLPAELEPHAEMCVTHCRQGKLPRQCFKQQIVMDHLGAHKLGKYHSGVKLPTSNMMSVNDCVRFSAPCASKGLGAMCHDQFLLHMLCTRNWFSFVVVDDNQTEPTTCKWHM